MKMQIKYILIGIVIIVVIAIYYFSSSTSSTSTNAVVFNGSNLYSFPMSPGDFSLSFELQTNEVLTTLLHNGIKTDNSIAILLNIVNGVLVLETTALGVPQSFTNSKLVVNDNKLHKIKFDRVNKSVWQITLDGFTYSFPQLGFVDYSSMYVGGIPKATRFFVGDMKNFMLNDKPITLVKTLPV